MARTPAGTSPSQRRHNKSIEKRQQILDAAARALAEHGYAKTKLSDIAREAGTHAGSLYYYFPSREDLMKEVMLTAVEHMSELPVTLSDDHGGPSPLDRIQAFVRAAIDQLVSMKSDFYLRAYLRNYDQVPDSIRTALKTRRRNLRRALTRLIDEAQATGQIPPHVDRVVATQFIAGATNWIALWYEPSGSTSARQITETFLDLMLHGLLGAQGPHSSSSSIRSTHGGTRNKLR